MKNTLTLRRATRCGEMLTHIRLSGRIPAAIYRAGRSQKTQMSRVGRRYVGSILADLGRLRLSGWALHCQLDWALKSSQPQLYFMLVINCRGALSESLQIYVWLFLNVFIFGLFRLCYLCICTGKSKVHYHYLMFTLYGFPFLWKLLKGLLGNVGNHLLKQK